MATVLVAVIIFIASYFIVEKVSVFCLTMYGSFHIDNFDVLKRIAKFRLSTKSTVLYCSISLLITAQLLRLAW